MNTVHGNDAIDRGNRSALFAAGRKHGRGRVHVRVRASPASRYAQVRAVSNVVERRNRAAWKLSEAVESLARTAQDVLADV